MNIKRQIYKMAKQDVKTLVFPEAGYSDRIIKAVRYGTMKRLFNAILIADESSLFLKYSSIANEYIQIVNSKTSELKDRFACEIYELRKHKGISKEKAEELASDPIYFATMLVKDGYADGLVSGAESVTASTYKPALELIKGINPNCLVSTASLFVGKNKVVHSGGVLVGDTALVENPTDTGLVDIAKSCTDLWKTFFIDEPRVAFLSYSTLGSATSQSVNKMNSATKLFQKAYPEVLSDGELQLDSAVLPENQMIKCPNSRLEGKANILIVPDINSGNILAKSLQTFAGLECIGPISLGFRRPVNDVSRCSSVEEIVLLSAITAIQAQLE